jgi:hypothetical protein
MSDYWSTNFGVWSVSRPSIQFCEIDSIFRSTLFRSRRIPVEVAQESTRFAVHSRVKMICAASFSFQSGHFRDGRRTIGKLRLTARIIRLRLEMKQQGRFPTPQAFSPGRLCFQSTLSPGTTVILWFGGM